MMNIVVMTSFLFYKKALSESQHLREFAHSRVDY